MRTTLRVALRVTLLALGLLFLGSKAASAADSLPLPLLGDEVVETDVELPIDLCGVGVAVGADTSTSCRPATSTAAAEEPDTGTSLVDLDAEAPISLCGVTVAVLADTSTTCRPVTLLEGTALARTGSPLGALAMGAAVLLLLGLAAERAGRDPGTWPSNSWGRSGPS